MPTLRHPLHPPAAQLLLANLAHVLETHLITFSQLAQTYPATLICLQNPAAQIIRIRSSHAFRVAELIASSNLLHSLPPGYIYLGTALVFGDIYLRCHLDCGNHWRPLSS